MPIPQLKNFYLQKLHTSHKHITGQNVAKNTHYLSKLIRWWSRPPALPRPAGCFRCLPAPDIYRESDPTITQATTSCCLLISHTQYTFLNS